MHFQLLGLAALGSLAAAAPAPSRTSELVERGSSCTFTSAAQASESAKSCSNIVLKNIAVPAGETLDLSKAKDGATITFEGTTTFGYKEWKGPLIRFGGNKITVTQASGAVIDGQGSRWWDGKGTNGGKTKPKFIYAHKLQSSTIKGLHVKNSPVQVFSVQGNDVHLTDITIDNSDGDNNGGHNTDAFDVSESNGVYITGANVKNQDDCLAINSGENIEFTGATCSGGHGISIGSIGNRDSNTVKNVKVADSTVVDSDNGIRIKTISGATGSVSGVTYENITLKNIKKNGIVIEQDYKNGGPTGKPTTGVPITDLTVNGVTGSVASKATPVYILCGKGSCSDWTWKGVSISGGKKSDKCQNIPSGASC
ncbi:putative endopolygalacturonase I [Aspergillus minisclerotigenes]|uniref:endo-polygalacturonase n=1 Tax=Aspergillus minisclerotigenes TaxID=656917 RepID=A0A5N6J9Y2_9EURO|nr:putative endopolygalacturonase I [Aspergillus minisclerotigenes]